MVYNENNFLKILYFCLIRCRSPPALPCPALPLALPSLALPSPALPSLALPLPLPCPISNFPFAARDRRRKLHRDRRKKLHRELFFLLLPGTGGGSYTGNGQCCFSFCCQGQEEEITQGTGSCQALPT